MAAENKIISMRRKDRAVEDISLIKQMLRKAPFGVLATVSEEQPMVHFNTFVYDEDSNALYMHTAKKGTTRDMVTTNPKVSFGVGEMGRLLPARQAREMSVEFSSVVLYGQAEIMTDMNVAREKMQLFIDKYFTHLNPGEDYEELTEKAIEEISVIKVSIKCWGGKAKKERDDFPGAFEYNQ